MHIFYGGTSISPEADIKLWGEGVEDGFGQRVASAYANVDDSSEVVIGAWKWNNSTGKAYVFGSIPSENEVPSLSSYGLMVLVTLIILSTVWLLRRNRRASLFEKS